MTGLAALFLITQVVHIYDMYQHHVTGNVRFRQASVIGSALSVVAMALWVIYLFVRVNL